MIYSSPWINLFLLMAIKMVLCGAVAGADEYLGAVAGNASRVRRAPAHHKYTASMTEEEMEATSWKRSHWREMQAILRREGAARDEVECCPSVVQMVETKGGKTPTGLYVELYKDGENTQRLYELSCAPGVKDMPCRFVDSRLYNHSKCVQKYSYSYALVRYTTEVPHRQRNEGHFSVPGGWSMDYVIVRAGCECQIKPPRKAAHRKRLERHRQRRKNRRQEEDDDT
ncbi:uncharacterized protein LOC106711462 isoform X1 [Papilio machaon]|uniref:uncharacterized protein LOC106711462 isoform X1 n=1 Tax=Papilio machaon TaxID=76193 RepID=UPI0006EADA43|nr:uncharacterized protein LOC106711462 isoform X1 [Papilio machaon]